MGRARLIDVGARWTPGLEGRFRLRVAMFDMFVVLIKFVWNTMEMIWGRPASGMEYRRI